MKYSKEKLNTLLEALIQAAQEDVMKGAGPLEDIPVVEFELEQAKKNITEYFQWVGDQ